VKILGCGSSERGLGKNAGGRFKELKLGEWMGLKFSFERGDRNGGFRETLEREGRSYWGENHLLQLKEEGRNTGRRLTKREEEPHPGLNPGGFCRGGGGGGGGHPIQKGRLNSGTETWGGGKAGRSQGISVETLKHLVLPCDKNRIKAGQLRGRRQDAVPLGPAECSG